MKILEASTLPKKKGMIPAKIAVVEEHGNYGTALILMVNGEELIRNHRQADNYAEAVREFFHRGGRRSGARRQLSER